MQSDKSNHLWAAVAEKFPCWSLWSGFFCSSCIDVSSLADHKSFLTSLEASAELSCDHKPATRAFCQQTNTPDLLLLGEFTIHSFLSPIICFSTQKCSWLSTGVCIQHRASVWDRCWGEQPWLARMQIPPFKQTDSINQMTALTKAPPRILMLYFQDLHSNGAMNPRLTTEWWQITKQLDES